MARISWILARIFGLINRTDPQLVVMEGLAFASHDRDHERAGLAFLVRYKLWQMNIPYALVAPTSLKKFTCGSGKAEKDQMMLAVYKRWKLDPANNNEADAISLLKVAEMLAGIEEPEMKAQQQVIAKVRQSLVPGKNGSTL